MQLTQVKVPTKSRARNILVPNTKVTFYRSASTFRSQNVLHFENIFSLVSRWIVEMSAWKAVIVSSGRLSHFIGNPSFDDLFVYLSITDTLDPTLRSGRDEWTVRYWVPCTAMVLHILRVLKSKARGTHLKQQDNRRISAEYSDKSPSWSTRHI